jgi:general secretion pathway protein A
VQGEHSHDSDSDGYEPFFGLAEAPFTLTSSPRFLFESASYLAAFKEIAYALSRREQIIVVTGPIGTGKTTLCRMIGERRDPRTFVGIVSSPPQTVDDLLRQILDGFELLTDDTRSIVEASRYGLLRVLRQFLDSLIALKAQAILVFDEAQHLPANILEEIRLLLNLDTDGQVLQIVLVGQPELDAILARTELGQMDQRISRRHRLEPLQLAEVSAYVECRISVAQSEQHSGDRPAFTDSATEAIASLSRGVPRVVNILCDRSLENAWADQTHTVDAGAVARAARLLNIEVPPALAPPPLAAPADAPALATAPSISTETIGRARPRRAQVAVVAVLAGSALLVWTLRGGSRVQPNRETNAQSTAIRETGSSLPPSVRPAPGVSSAPIAADAASAAAVVRQEATSTADNFLIVVSSFRTRDRATQVATDIAALNLPAFVRTIPGWEQVVVGPYPSRPDAIAAQDQLVAAHFTDTEVTQTSPLPSAPR